MPRRTLLTIVLVGGGAVVLVAGLVWWRADDGAALDHGDVVVIGDSVTDQSAHRIEAELGGDVVVAGFPGYRTGDLLPIVTEAIDGEDPPAVAVVMAGYNDVWKGQEDEAEVEALMDVLGRADCAVWVLVPTEGPWPLERAQDFEQRVVEAAEASGVEVETGWRDAVDGTDGPDPDPELVVPDGVHPSEAGQQRVAEVMAAAVDRLCG